MRRISSWFWLGALLLLGGCAGTGAVPHPDPLARLNEAESLFRQQVQPVLAEKLIREAIDIYARRGDAHGLGNGTANMPIFFGRMRLPGNGRPTIANMGSRTGL